MLDSDVGQRNPRNGAMSLSCPERIAAAIPAEARASRIARARTFAAVHESGSVQVFGRRQRRSNHTLWRPASEKRQGTKSREVGHWLAASPMGILISAPTSFAGEGRHAECIGWYRSRGGNA